MNIQDKKRIESLIVTVNALLTDYLTKEASQTAKKRYIKEIKENEELFKRLQPKKPRL